MLRFSRYAFETRLDRPAKYPPDFLLHLECETWLPFLTVPVGRTRSTPIPQEHSECISHHSPDGENIPSRWLFPG